MTPANTDPRIELIGAPFPEEVLDEALDETFESLIFDWDGTAVPDRQASAADVRERIEALSSVGVHLFVVTGTHVGNIDSQLRARPSGPGRLYLCCNRGSEVFEVSERGPDRVFRRTATGDEDRALNRAAAATVERLASLGLEAHVVSERLNRRKIDLIPLPEWAEPKKADIAGLIEAVVARLAAVGVDGLGEVVSIAAEAARANGLADPRITSDVKHVEIGLTDKSDSARFAAGWLAERGIAGRLVLIAGDELGPLGDVPGSDSLILVDELQRAVAVSVGVEPGGVPGGVVHLGGGPGRFARLLDLQLARRSAHRVPQIDLDPRWVVPLPAARSDERVAESLGTLANGLAGTRGSREEDGRGSSLLFVAGGIFTNDDSLLSGPLWTGLELHGAGGHHADRRLLDLRTGTLARFDPRGSGLRSIRFASVASPHALAMRAEAPIANIDPGDPLGPPEDAVDFVSDEHEGVRLARTGRAPGGGITMAARDRVAESGGKRVIERLAAWVASPTGPPSFEDALERFEGADTLGFDALLAEQRAGWARRWADAEVVIEGSPEDELLARFAVFHLLSVAPESGEAAVGARGLSGDAYRGHVLWDADVFVLPVLAAIHPGAARAMLEYRIRRLPLARSAAEGLGRRGARFPWESATDGSDVTPREARPSRGRPIPILTGQCEEHIVADVAWAAARYAAWTGDTAFLASAGGDLIVETARYWASRLVLDSEGRGHLYGVMGPDEYHEIVDDDAYTNVMARWNLRSGAELLATRCGDAEEAAAWRTLADGLVDGWDAERGVYEQFDGYFDLEQLLISEVATPPVAADVLLGAKRVAGSQIIKQADVLMLHHLLPGEVVPGSLVSCLEFYEPRTAHGSSLSPAIHASLSARAGHPGRALELFRLSGRLDLDDLTGTTAGGLHVATMGGLWQALAYGFLGLRSDGEVLEVDPCLPEEWSALALRFRFGGRRVGVRAEHDGVTVTCDEPLYARVGGQVPQRCEPPAHRVALDTRRKERSRP